MRDKLILLTLLLVSFSSLAQDIAVPEIQEKDRQEAADFISGIQSKTNSDYEFEAQKIVERAEEVKKQAAKIHAKDVSEVAEKISKVQQSKNYKYSEVWIKKNQN